VLRRSNFKEQLDGRRPTARRPPIFASPIHGITTDGLGSSSLQFAAPTGSIHLSTMLATNPTIGDVGGPDMEPGNGKDNAYWFTSDKKLRSLSMTAIANKCDQPGHETIC
jgi:hypothetical protein